MRTAAERNHEGFNFTVRLALVTPPPAPATAERYFTRPTLRGESAAHRLWFHQTLPVH